jgi:hypothetical protein
MESRITARTSTITNSGRKLRRVLKKAVRAQPDLTSAFSG